MLPEPYYDEDGITIYHGDCRDILPHLPKFDLLLTDPPYGINYGKQLAGKGDGKGGMDKNGWRSWGEPTWDESRPESFIFDQLIISTSNQVIWGGNYFADLLPPTMRWLIWDKGQRNFSLADCELAWTSENKAARIFTYTRGEQVADGRNHPTQKPLKLMSWCLEFFPQAQTVLDPFMGSGTTLVAAKMRGLKAVGIEREKEYCDIAIERLAQGVLFGGDQ